MEDLVLFLGFFFVSVCIAAVAGSGAGAGTAPCPHRGGQLSCPGTELSLSSGVVSRGGYRCFGSEASDGILKLMWCWVCAALQPQGFKQSPEMLAMPHSQGATASDAEIVKLRQMLQHRQADLVRAELQADMAARRASELLQQSELELPSSTSRSPRTPEPPAANLSLPSGKRASAGPDLSARVSADLENILEAVKQHELNMAAVKSELVSEAAMSLQGKGDAAAVDEMLVLTRLRSRRDEHEEQNVQQSAVIRV